MLNGQMTHVNDIENNFDFMYCVMILDILLLSLLLFLFNNGKVKLFKLHELFMLIVS